MNKMIMNRLTMLAVTLMASMACFAQGKFDKGLVTSIGTGKALYDIFDYQELRYRVTKENWTNSALNLSGYEVEVIGFASQITGVDGHPEYISNVTGDSNGDPAFDGTITIGHVITKDVAGVDIHVVAVAENAFTSTTCYNDDAANKTKFAAAAEKVKTIEFDFNRGNDDKFVDFSVPTIGANAFAGLTSLENVNCYSPVASTASNSIFDEDVYTYGTLYLPEGTGVAKAYSKVAGWQPFLLRYVGNKLMGDCDNNKKIKTSDANYLKSLIMDDEYDEMYDFDGSGKLKSADLNFLKNIILSL